MIKNGWIQQVGMSLTFTIGPAIRVVASFIGVPLIKFMEIEIH